MKVGILVQRFTQEDDGRGFPKSVMTGPLGVVFYVEYNGSASPPRPGEPLTATLVKVRWFDGREEEFVGDNDKDQSAGDELADVTPALYVNVYLIDRAYGGPEEGGWWYDTGELVRSTQCDTEAAAEVKRAEEEAACNVENHGKPDISSVRSEGRYAVRVESEAGADYPAARPHYC